MISSAEACRLFAGGVPDFLPSNMELFSGKSAEGTYERNVRKKFASEVKELIQEVEPSDELRDNVFLVSLMISSFVEARSKQELSGAFVEFLSVVSNERLSRSLKADLVTGVFEAKVEMHLSEMRQAELELIRLMLEYLRHEGIEIDPVIISKVATATEI